MRKSPFLISLVLLGLCFLPALVVPFAHHDLARVFDRFYNSPAFNPDNRDPQYFLGYLLGRPAGAEVQQFLYRHVHQIGDLSLARAVTVGIFAVCAGLLANIFLSFGLAMGEAMALSTSIFLLPGVQDAVIMAAIQNALVVWAALWAYTVWHRPRTSRGDGIWRMIVFFSLMLAGMMLYPQWTYFLFVPVLAKGLVAPAERWRDVFREFRDLAAAFVVIAVFYYLDVKMFLSPHNDSWGYTFSIGFGPLGRKLGAIGTEIVPLAFNAWNIYTIQWLGLALAVITAVLLRKRAVLCVVFFVWSLGFWLASSTTLILPRIFFVTSAMALTAMLMGLRGVFRPGSFGARYVIGIAATAGFILSFHTVTWNALNYYAEFAAMKQCLVVHRGKPLERIHIILPTDNGRGYNGRPTVGDTFNAKTASYYFPWSTLNLLRAAMKEAGVPSSRYIDSCDKGQSDCLVPVRSKNSILVTHAGQNQPVVPSPNMILIDLNALRI